jgi:hypothetical protein
VRPHKTALRPGIDAVSLNQLVDELEDEAVMRRGSGGAGRNPCGLLVLEAER